MAGRRRIRMRSLSAIINDVERVIPPAPPEQVTEIHIPEEILELIFSRLSLCDNISVASICRSWRRVALSTRKVNKSPLLMYEPNKGDWCDFYDPLERKIYFRELPAPPPVRSSICYCRSSWILFFMPRTRQVKFFCPYTLESVELPVMQLPERGAAFSAPPMSPDCVVFVLNDASEEDVEISTWRLGDMEWVTTIFPIERPFITTHMQQIVFHKGRFYIFGNNGCIGVFDPVQQTFDVLPVQPPPCRYERVAEWGKKKFMAEHNDDIFLVCACTIHYPIVYKLDEINNRWEEVNDLGGATFFAGFTTSIIGTDMLGVMRNSIYFPKVMYHGKRCVVYSLTKERFFPRRDEGMDCGKLHPDEAIWMDPPEDFSIFQL